MRRVITKYVLHAIGQQLSTAAPKAFDARQTYIHEEQEYARKTFSRDTINQINQMHTTSSSIRGLSDALNKASTLCAQGSYKKAGEIYTEVYPVVQRVHTEYAQHLNNMFRAYSAIGDKDALEQLVTENIGYFKTYKDQDTGNTALHTLLTHRMYDTAKLIATEENCRVKNNDGYTPIHIAFENDGLSFVQDTLLPIVNNTPKPSMDDVMLSIIRTAPYADNHFVELAGQLFDASN